MTTVELNTLLAGMQNANSVANLVTLVNGVLQKANTRMVANFAFGTVNNAEDLDNPTTKGVFNVNDNTIITKPTIGSGWKYGYVINLCVNSGIQIWFNFDGYLAIRGKTSSTAAWKAWDVMAKIS